MTSIAFISGSNKNDGMQVGTRQYERELSPHYSTQWYQCIDPSYSDIAERENTVIGVKFPLAKIELGINRLFVFPRRFKERHHDLYILTDPTLYKIPNQLEKTVIKIHDLRPITQFADNFFTTMMYKMIIPKIGRARGIIVTTEWMKQIVMDNIKGVEKVFVIPESHNYDKMHQEHIASSIKKIEMRTADITFIGTDRGYKNLSFFLDYAEKLSQMSGFNFRFHVVSKLEPRTKRKVLSRTIKGLYLHESVPAMEEIYQDTDIYVQPSLYEGFGRPSVEAMVYGIPVISNDIEPFREVVGNAGLFAPVSGLDKWVGTTLNLLDSSVYQRIADYSLSRASLYTPKEQEKRLLAAVRLLLNS